MSRKTVSLQAYCWIFMIAYVCVMVWFGVVGQRRVQSADDFATARGSYGPWFLALAFTSTVASGATFLGIPGLAYTFGLPPCGSCSAIRLVPTQVYWFANAWWLARAIASGADLSRSIWANGIDPMPSG